MATLTLKEALNCLDPDEIIKATLKEDWREPMIIGLDIDGTAFFHAYPKLGHDIGAFPWLRLAQDRGAKYIIFTMRDGAELKEAVRAVRAEGIHVIGVNHNITQHEWTQSPKPYCHLYLDDNGLGMPLRGDRNVDWTRAGPMLLDAVDAWNERHPDGIGRKLQ